MSLFLFLQKIQMRYHVTWWLWMSVRHTSLFSCDVLSVCPNLRETQHSAAHI